MARNGLTFDDLLGMARRVGVDVVAAPSSHRGQKGRMGTVVGVTRHHTGTANSLRPDEDFPDYQVVKEGRAGLVNSLSAFGLGRHRAIYVFSEFLSWHAGTWSYAGITDGNGHFLGIEAAGVGDWTDWQIDVYPRLVASILLDLGEGVDMMPRHADGAMPRGRKDDARNLPADFTATVQHYLDHPELIPVTAAPAAPAPEEHPEMKVIQSDKRGIALVGAGYYRQLVDAEDVVSATMLWGAPHVDNERRFDVWVSQATQGTASSTSGQLTALAAQVAGIKPADVDEQALANLLAPKLAGATADQIAEALREVLRTGVDG